MTFMRRYAQLMIAALGLASVPSAQAQQPVAPEAVAPVTRVQLAKGDCQFALPVRVGSRTLNPAIVQAGAVG